MKIYHSFASLGEIHNPVVTTGSFDGVHIGHKTILRRLNKLARDIGGESVLITFHPHPRRVLYPDTQGKDLLLICSQEEKKYLLEKTGLDHLVIIDFTPDFAAVSCRDFINDYLVKILDAKIVVVGFNHHFGHNQEGNFDYLYQLSRQRNFEVEEIPEQDIQNESVSSTKIRKALFDGNIQRANAYLDHYYIIKGTSVVNEKRSKLLGKRIFTLSIQEDVKLVPSNGVYAVNVEVRGEICKALFSVENWGIVNSRVSDVLQLEFHMLDNPEFEGGEALVCFHKKIREGLNGSASAEVQKQFIRDIENVRDLIY